MGGSRDFEFVGVVVLLDRFVRVAVTRGIWVFLRGFGWWLGRF